jgi:hypothetical protein
MQQTAMTGPFSRQMISERSLSLFQKVMLVSAFECTIS